MNLLKALLNFYLYSSLHIAIAASAFSLEICYLFDIDINYYLLAFVFCSTIFIYSIHRIIGINTVPDVLSTGRYSVIRRFKSHIYIYAVLSVILIVFLLFKIPQSSLIYLIILGMISLSYTLPVFSSKKRLRDFDFIKIFLIAISWALISLLQYSGNYLSMIVALVFIEHSLYILSITLPFDVRDLEVDQSNNVKTLASYWGHSKTYKWAYGLMFVCWGITLLAIYNHLNYLNINIILLISVAYLFSAGCIRLSRNKSSDYYYSGLLDGVIILRSIILISIFEFIF